MDVTQSAAKDPAKQWARQWKMCGRALREQSAREARQMTPQEALRLSNAVLGLAGVAYFPKERLLTSGLVEQQRYFKKWKS
jgi:hypothetical protein